LRIPRFSCRVGWYLRHGTNLARAAG
jgi:hypothetical protein